VVPVDVPEQRVHERVELHRGGVGGRVDADVGARLAEGGFVGGDDEAEPAADGAFVERGDGEGELRGEAGAERDGCGVERAAGAGGGDGEVAGEADGGIVPAPARWAERAGEMRNRGWQVGPRI
jgi:hypothetical protein